MDGFERRKEHSKEDIRRAAEELFTRFGEDKVSINDIARRAGVSQATIYNNFGSKEALVHCYRESVTAVVRRRFRDILVLKKSYAEKLQDLFQSWIDMTDRYNIRPNPAVTTQSQQTQSSAGGSLTQEIETALLEFIKTERETGGSVSKASEEAVRSYIRFIQEGLANHPEIQNRMQKDSALSRDLLELFLYGINGQNESAQGKKPELIEAPPVKGIQSGK